MDFRTTLLFKHLDGVCGCPEYWGGFESTPPGPAIPSSFPHLHPQQCKDADGLPFPISRQQAASSTGARCPGAKVCPKGALVNLDLSVMSQSQRIDSPATDSSHTLPLTSMRSASLWSSSPSPPPACQPEETCFFWYHGVCRRGKWCDRQHKTHITWPISVPPGYVHWVPCSLLMCPLRKDLVELAQGTPGTDATMAKDGVDGQAVGKAGATSGEGVDKDLLEVEEMLRIIAAQIEADNKDDNDETGRIDFGDTDSSNTASTFKPTPPLSSLSPGIPSENNTEAQVTSISHAGTLGRNKRNPPLNHAARTGSKHKRPRLDPSGDASQQAQTSIRELPARSAQNQHPKSTEDRPISLREPSRGPRADEESPEICFYWYHNGFCAPRQLKNSSGRATCRFIHKLTAPIQRVSCPPHTRGHDPDCSLPLCPFRSSKMTAAAAINLESVNPVDSSSLPLANAGPSSRQETTATRLQPGEKRKRIGPEQFEYEGNGKRAERKLEDYPARVLEESPLASETTKARERRKKGVLVDYDLPEGDDRAEWDTDYLRRAFGEIE